SMDDVDTLRSNIYSMDIDTEGDDSSRRLSQYTPQSRSQNWQISVDFSDLDADHRNVSASYDATEASQDMQRLSLSQHSVTADGSPDTSSSTERLENQFIERLRQLTEEIERIAPNMKAIERLDGMEARLR